MPGRDELVDVGAMRGAVDQVVDFGHQRGVLRFAAPHLAGARTRAARRGRGGRSQIQAQPEIGVERMRVG